MRIIKIVSFVSLLFVMSIKSWSGDSGLKTGGEQDWAIGLSIRSATIPYSTDTEKQIYSVIPMIFYEGERFYFRGIGGGIHIYKEQDWQINGISRIHFVDLPNEYQNNVQPTNLDWGLQVRHYLRSPFYWEAEALLDMDSNLSANLRFGLDLKKTGFRINPYAEIKIKSKDYNTQYFGLTLEPIDWGLDYSLGVMANYHVWSNFHLFAAARITLLDKNARKARYVQDDLTGEAIIGFGFSNDPGKPRKKALHNRPYLRIAHGWGSNSDFKQNIIFIIDPDPYNNQLTSVFYGHPLTDSIFGIPLDLYLTSGFTWHWPSSVQSNAAEIVLAIKAYVNIPWPIRWRIGAAEGFSYITSITHIERNSYEPKGYEPVNFLNFLDWSYDFNVGDVFGDQLNHLWFGYSVHHRSGIFELSQHFGRVNAGSDYYTFYLQWDF